MKQHFVHQQGVLFILFTAALRMGAGAQYENNITKSLTCMLSVLLTEAGWSII
jgi:hypothetical protein